MTIHLAPPADPDGRGTPAHDSRPRSAAARTRPAGRVLLAAGLVLVVVAAAAWVGARRAGAAGTRTVVVTMHHSTFQPAVITVAPGTEVRFVLRNTDPIDHEFIIGPPAVHDLHERGTQRVHDGPGEVTVPAGEERSTTVSFNLAAGGQLRYACHLPGHYAYGMHGVVTVRR
jgi:uncharacterized cupredoxin-like copper-binding protein